MLLGGQDGWIDSPTFADPVSPFLSGGLIRVPLRPLSITAAFLQRIHLLPDQGDPPVVGVDHAPKEFHLPK